MSAFMEKCGVDGIEEECRELLEPVFKLIRLVYKDTSHVQMRMNEFGYGIRSLRNEGEEATN